MSHRRRHRPDDPPTRCALCWQLWPCSGFTLTDEELAAIEADARAGEFSTPHDVLLLIAAIRTERRSPHQEQEAK